MFRKTLLSDVRNFEQTAADNWDFGEPTPETSYFTPNYAWINHSITFHDLLSGGPVYVEYIQVGTDAPRWVLVFGDMLEYNFYSFSPQTVITNPISLSDIDSADYNLIFGLRVFLMGSVHTAFKGIINIRAGDITGEILTTININID